MFSCVLDPDARHFLIRPAVPCVSQRAYLDGTLVLQTDHNTATGVLRVTDAIGADPRTGEPWGNTPQALAPEAMPA